jgi:putative redox protein
MKDYQVEITAGPYNFLADESFKGQEGIGPCPYELLLGALAACKIITVQMYARRKGWPLAGVEVDLSTHKIYARDCEESESDPNARIDIIEEEITFHGEINDEQRARLSEIIERCPVQRTLLSETKIRSKVS